MSTPSQEYQSDIGKINMSKQPGCIIELEIHLNPIAAKAAYQKAVKNINKEASFPGFRKGKAPENLIIKKFPQQIDQEWRQEIFDKCLTEGFKITNTYPLDNEAIKKAKINSLSLDDGGVIQLAYESAPMIPEIDLSQVHLKNDAIGEASEKDVADSLQELRRRYAKVTAVEDREVQEGDTVDVLITPLEDELLGETGKTLRLEVSDNPQMPGWVKAAILGKKLNESVEAHSDAKESKPFRLTVEGIFTSELPTDDEEFAKSLGAENIEDLKKKIEEMLNRDRRAMHQDHLRAQMRDALLQRFAFDIPGSMVEKTMKDVMGEKARALPRELSSDERKEKLDKMESSVKKNIEESFQLLYITQKIAKEQQFNVTQYEIITQLMEDHAVPSNRPEDLMRLMNHEETVNWTFKKVLTKKVLDHLVEQALVNQPSLQNEKTDLGQNA